MEPKIANLPRSRNGNIAKVDRRARLTTECEGDVSTLGSIYLDTPSPEPALDTGEVGLKGAGNGVRIRVTGEDTGVISKRG